MAVPTPKPTTPFVLGFMGGAIDLVVAVGVIAEAPSMASLAGGSYPVSIVTVFTVYGALGVIFAAFSIAASVLLYVRPARHRLWGALILVFALLSWVGSLGGGVIGSILGLVGGASGLKWQVGAVAPAEPTPAMPQQPAAMICPTCGRALTSEMRFCPYCGRSLQ